MTQRSQKRTGKLCFIAAFVVGVTSFGMLSLATAQTENGETGNVSEAQPSRSSSQSPLFPDAPVAAEQTTEAAAAVVMPDIEDVLHGNLDPQIMLSEIPEDWTSRPGLYAEADTLEAYGRMRAAAEADGVDLVILSAFRSFQQQRSIWDRKWQDREASGYLTGARDRALDIMRYSSMPGTSRHHWGTDLDLNALNNDWFETTGGKRVYDWMKANAAGFGFCEVYSARDGRRERGYEPERWHWSYIPTASRYLAAYAEANGFRPQGFSGDNATDEIEWLNDYVLGINPDCLWKASDTGAGRTLPPPLLEAVEQGGSADSVGAGEQAQHCVPEGWSRQILVSWKDSEFPVEDTADRDGYLMVLLDCLSDPDPVLRDEVAYGGITHMLRGGDIAPETLREMKRRLLAQLAPGARDPDGLSKPFAALALSEVARTDRIEAWMSDAERRELVNTGTAYLKEVRDYRGFIEGEGWRHGVAHGADLLMQLSLNAELPDGAAGLMLEAVGAQIASDVAPAYIFDEPRRLARPVIFLTQAGLLSEDHLTAWFEAIAAPAPLESWNDAFTSQSALARRHNLRAFGYAILTAVNESADAALEPLRPGAVHLLTSIP